MFINKHTMGIQWIQSLACPVQRKDLFHSIKSAAKSKACPCWGIQDKYATETWSLRNL